jgi:hypothetical protein
MNRSETTPEVSSAGKLPILDVNKLVSQFVLLRDRKREMEQQYKDQIRPFDKLLDEIGNKLLDYMQQAGVDNVSTPSGSAHQITKRSATIRNGSAFREFVIESEAFDLVDWKANAVAVFDFIENNEGTPPPGVNASSFTRVGVRRPNEKE